MKSPETWDGCYVGVLRCQYHVIYRSEPVTTWDEAFKRANKRRLKVYDKVEVMDSVQALKELK